MNERLPKSFSGVYCIWKEVTVSFANTQNINLNLSLFTLLKRRRTDKLAVFRPQCDRDYSTDFRPHYSQPFCSINFTENFSLTSIS